MHSSILETVDIMGKDDPNGLLQNPLIYWEAEYLLGKQNSTDRLISWYHCIHNGHGDGDDIRILGFLCLLVFSIMVMFNKNECVMYLQMNHKSYPLVNCYITIENHHV